MEAFVEGWNFVETLGEGAFGEYVKNINYTSVCGNINVTDYIIIFISVFFTRVKLAINQTTQEAIAVKIINLKQVACPDDIRKEVCFIYLLFL